ncbi:MAG: 50S ribosomal protein L20 [Candidatus Woesebacteria bacterium GW2011_GWB1_43_14]|uniref:Large ribosomal subunit protein bL20 n=1 Tax=Candidatus Woesebacteria bacterium GW2011_GWB1_43_14 TaxID=1618578 RepID=A0A0G1DH74_9BACT|nr:MAG: 50S ribosomal protein L20, large subunit ribosomal protein L20 [Candidatus Woesebacteria bacterium GW2011_GWC1_42_9]KKS97059.1 MAG: 50S ribosomal protein L20 [Candidatus Woesebacteria bacterium GW2011_GWB1_43_14]
MSRAKSPAAKRHREQKKKAKGYKHTVGRRVKTTKDALLHAGQYAYTGRKNKKRKLRALWTMRLNAASREHGFTYSKLIAGLKKANIELDRKILSDIAVRDPKTFKKILTVIK